MTSPREAVVRGRLLRLRLAIAAYAILAAVLGWAYLRNAQQSIEARVQDRVRLHARILERETASLLDAVGLTLGQVGADLRGEAVLDAAHVAAALKNAAGRRTDFRSLSIVDGEGRVLASTVPDNSGHVIALTDLGGPSEDDRARIGPAFAGRDLADLDSRRAAGAPPVASGMQGVPVLRRIERLGAPAFAVAVLDPTRIATHYSVLLQEAADRAALFSYGGQVLAAGMTVPLAPGTWHRDLALFTQHLPHAEQGQYIGPGLDGRPALVAYRGVRNLPLLVLTEEPLATVTQQVARVRAPVLLAVGAALGALLLIWLVLERSLRAAWHSEEQLLAAHEETARAEERLQLAVSGAELGVWDVDLVTGAATLSPRLLSLLGYVEEPTAWAASRVEALLHPGDRVSVRQASVAHLKGLAPAFSMEMRVRARDGSWMWLLVRGTVSHRDGKGRALRIAGTAMDIQARRRAESALRASEARQRAILDNTLDAMLLVDGERRVLAVNPAAERLLGARAGTVLSQDWARLVRPSGPGTAGRRIELAVRAPDARMVTAELSVVPVPAEDGTIFALTLHDLTHRRQAEQSLRESEARFRAAFDQAAVGMFQRGSDGRLTMVNKRLCGLLGYTPEEFGALSIEALVHPDDLQGWLGGFRRTLSGELATFRQETRYRHKEGHWVWLLLTASPARDAQGHVASMIGVVEDIGQRKRVEQELAQSRDRELAIGLRIQQELLVDQRPQPNPGVWLSLFNQASRGIDGDFLEVLAMGENVVDIVAADVMGKGIPAALLGAGTKLELSRTINRLLIRRPGDGIPQPRDIVLALNASMAPHLEALEAFVTLVYLRLDLMAGTLTWVGCGHEEPLVVSADGRERRLPNAQPPLGLLGHESCTQQSLPFHLGDMVFLCSDGATDALLPDGSRLGRDRVDAAAGARLRAHGSPAMALHRMRRDLFRRGVEFTDDVTLVMAVRRDAATHARLELPVDLGSLRPLRAFLEARLARLGISEDTRAVFVAGVIEAFTNIVRHGRGLLQDAPVEVVAQLEPETLVVDLRYLGEPYVPPDDPPESDFAAFPEGGFGLYIIQHAADSVEYLHEDGVNIVRLAIARPATLGFELDLP